MKAPGVYFLSREDVYLSVSLFGHNKRTRLLTADFPLYVQQELVFDKVLPRGVVGGGGDSISTIPVKILYEIWNVDSEFT